MKCDMKGRAGRIVVRFEDVQAHLRRGYEFATKEDKAKYEASLKPKAESEAIVPLPSGRKIQIDMKASDDESGI